MGWRLGPRGSRGTRGRDRSRAPGPGWSGGTGRERPSSSSRAEGPCRSSGLAVGSSARAARLGERRAGHRPRPRVGVRGRNRRVGARWAGSRRHGARPEGPPGHASRLPARRGRSTAARTWEEVPGCETGAPSRARPVGAATAIRRRDPPAEGRQAEPGGPEGLRPGRRPGRKRAEKGRRGPSRVAATGWEVTTAPADPESRSPAGPRTTPAGGEAPRTGTWRGERRTGVAAIPPARKGGRAGRVRPTTGQAAPAPPGRPATDQGRLPVRPAAACCPPRRPAAVVPRSPLRCRGRGGAQAPGRRRRRRPAGGQPPPPAGGPVGRRSFPGGPEVRSWP